MNIVSFWATVLGGLGSSAVVSLLPINKSIAFTIVVVVAACCGLGAYAITTRRRQEEEMARVNSGNAED